jgi:hypothetical protein
LATTLDGSPLMVAIAVGWQTDATQAPPRHECPHAPQFSGSEVVSLQAPLLDALLLALVDDEALVEEDELLDEALLALDEAVELLDELLPVEAAPPLPPLPSITMVVAQPARHTIQAPPTRIALRMSG